MGKAGLGSVLEKIIVRVSPPTVAFELVVEALVVVLWFPSG